ncbi:MAG: hypothetical protein MJ091_06410, partial [Clostridia bacterium]|nr:hypothetical protein [Clostridia bacterium]
IDQDRNDFKEGIYDNVDSNSKWNTFSINYLSDFDEYLLDNGYYLKCVNNDTHKVPESYRHKVYTSKWDLIGHWEDCGPNDSGAEVKSYKTYSDCYLQVYNAAKAGTNTGSCTPVKNASGQNLYFCMTFTQDDWNGLEKSGGGCVTKIDDATDKKSSANPEKMMFPLTKATIKYIYNNSCPGYSSFQTELKNSNGSSFSGNWHFLPWVLYRTATGASSGSRLESANNTMFCRNYANHNKYSPKTDAYKSIYYALQKDNTVKLINKNGDVMFSFDATNRTNPLSSASCVLQDIEATRKYNNADWKLYYKKGSMPQKQISKIVFENNVATVYDTSGSAFIRFIYKNGKFDQDKASVISGDYKDFFTFSGNTATVKEDYKGDIYFNCEKFDGPYSITTKELDKN